MKPAGACVHRRVLASPTPRAKQDRFPPAQGARPQGPTGPKAHGGPDSSRNAVRVQHLVPAAPAIRRQLRIGRTLGLVQRPFQCGQAGHCLALRPRSESPPAHRPRCRVARSGGSRAPEARPSPESQPPHFTAVAEHGASARAGNYLCIAAIGGEPFVRKQAGAQPAAKPGTSPPWRKARTKTVWGSRLRPGLAGPQQRSAATAQPSEAHRAEDVGVHSSRLGTGPAASIVFVDAPDLVCTGWHRSSMSRPVCSV